MSETAVYVAPAVAEVRALWDRSGARAGPVIGAQLSGANAAEITARLLDGDADPAARLRAYGATPDTLAMLKTSAHPRAVGVAANIERLLATH